MKRFMVSLFTLILSSSAFASEQCIKNETIGAVYGISQTNNSSEPKPVLNLWRMPKQVMHENLTNHISQLWHSVSKNQVQLIRYFDDDKRAIEYEPGEVKITNVAALWQQKEYLIDPAQFTHMALLKTQGDGCDQVETYQFSSNTKNITIEWMPKYKLVKSSTSVNNGITKQWQLIKVIKDQTTIKRAFSNRDNYQSTDYADIGDNESDPFLNKMIHLGHIEHHDAGFYDSEGHALDTNHSHH